MLKFKIRASAIGLIMTEPKGGTFMQKYVDAVAELKRLKELQASANLTTKTAIDRALKIDNLERIDIPLLEVNRDKITLSETCLSYVEKWIKEQPEFYGRTKEFTSKYTDKGNLCENDAIQFCAEQYGWGMVEKNTVRFESDEHIEGTPDIILAKSIDDTKVSWDHETFPLFDDVPDIKYEWQGHGYKAIVNKPLFGLHYCLMDAPESIVLTEAWKECRKLGMDELDADLYDEKKAHMTYSHLPIKLRLKSWFFERNVVAELAIRERVELIRKYIKTLNLNQYEPTR